MISSNSLYNVCSVIIVELRLENAAGNRLCTTGVLMYFLSQGKSGLIDRFPITIVQSHKSLIFKMPNFCGSAGFVFVLHMILSNNRKFIHPNFENVVYFVVMYDAFDRTKRTHFLHRSMLLHESMVTRGVVPNRILVSIHQAQF